MYPSSTTHVSGEKQVKLWKTGVLDQRQKILAVTELFLPIRSVTAESRPTKFEETSVDEKWGN